MTVSGRDAIAGLDGPGAVALGGLDEVRPTSTTPPHAWIGTPAEQVVDLRTCQDATEIFRGTAREAARSYPMNANLAATVALAGTDPQRAKRLGRGLADGSPCRAERSPVGSQSR
ncbi:MAG: DUF108 domain-containing protein [Actinobacteria bacterium]|nr:DUF108 domain-containing protein [Actinomycetota bacterium]